MCKEKTPNIILLYPSKEMPQEQLENQCIRPITFTSNQINTEAKILSSNLLRNNRKFNKEKW